MRRAGVLIQRRDDAKHDAQRDRQSDRRKRELNGAGGLGGEIAEHRTSGLHRASEVTLNGATDVFQVLDGYRIVESQLLAYTLHIRIGDLRLAAQHGQRRVTRNQVHHRKGRDGHPDQDRYREKQAARDVLVQRCLLVVGHARVVEERIDVL